MRKLELEPGQTVFWYEYYSDMILRDGGIGIILGVENRFIDYNIITYKVLKQKSGEIAVVSSENLEIIENVEIGEANV
jgi:hypothetical protein